MWNIKLLSSLCSAGKRLALLPFGSKLTPVSAAFSSLAKAGLIGWSHCKGLTGISLLCTQPWLGVSEH